MGKERKSLQGNEADADEKPGEAELSYEEKIQLVSPISKPMASRKLTKKLYKLIRKASKQKTFLRNGLKDVQTKIRKGETGLVIVAGDVTPIDVVCHLPGVCEDLSIPYVYTPSRQDIGAAMGVKRGAVTVMIRDHADYKELYDECSAEVSNLNSAAWTPS
ncbi:H/ACA ribonucleoprotein complex subunit 2-like protein [Ischnura elegans]|uniref:H/ACA ribonucleoprotein complex subunit 2-like protein n=1 Tax=Ischnura elegans TaxID=197161 RepID=UPI001ED8884F|nr:H/ACA ribonucleoprotein complex subunit 2-like protein [Ischnura elegans]